jgi:hypothetical protein
MSKQIESTLAALLQEKPKRGRPRRLVTRQSVYVALSDLQRQQLAGSWTRLPTGITRADIPDIAVTLLATRMEVLRRAVADRNREIPEGITDMDSLYLLWDLSLPDREVAVRWTSIRLSPQRVIDLGRTHGVLNALFGTSRSEVYGLGLALFDHFLRLELQGRPRMTLEEVDRWITRIYL